MDYSSIFARNYDVDIIGDELLHISEFTQQDGKKKRTALHLCVTNVTGLLLACFVAIFT